MPNDSDIAAGSTDSRAFVVGLALAGAVSAGAYTSGVLDFLIEALDAWESAKARGDNVPDHKVVISAISGTSAGGICAPLLAAALAYRDAPLTANNATKAHLPRLYDAWVTKTRLYGASNVVSFTSDEDLNEAADAGSRNFRSRPLRKRKRVRSLLNGRLLEEISLAALQPRPTQGGTTNNPRAYVSDQLHLFLMTGNLRGVPYAINFAETQKHGMLAHADRVHALVTGLGTGGQRSVWAAREPPGIALDATRIAAGSGLTPHWEKIRIAALATAAFPAGLPARIIAEGGSDKENRVWPLGADYYKPLDPANSAFQPAYPAFQPSWPGTATPERYSYVAADGGIANNEPFEYARWSIMKRPPESNPRGEIEADRAVIMVDPFPEPPNFDLGPDDDSMVAAIGGLIGTLIDQARFKLIELAEAQNEGTNSRHLVAPARKAAAGAAGWSGANAIACGLLGGFGGFLAERLRAHDYQLGRRNCQRFLQDVFALPEDSDLFRGKTISADFRTPTPGRRPVAYCQIVPLTGAARIEVPEPDWPQIAEGEVKDLMAAAGRRLDRVIPALLRDEIQSAISGWLGGQAWSMFLKKMVVDRIKAAVLQDLIRRNQYQPTGGLSELGRTLLALMYGDFGTRLTKFGLARRDGEQSVKSGRPPLTPVQIDAALNQELANFIVSVGASPTKDLDGKDVDAPAYVLKEYAPGFWSNVTGVFDQPPTD